MSIINIIGCANESAARTKSLEYDDLHTIVIGPADRIDFAPLNGAQSGRTDFGPWIVIATDGTIEVATTSASGS